MPLLTVFSDTSDMRADSKCNRIAVELDDLRRSQAGLHGQLGKNRVAPPNLGLTVRHHKDRLNLWTGEEMHLALVVELAGYREPSLVLSGIGGSSSATKRRKARMAVRRRLRVLMPTDRPASRSSRKVEINGASRSTRSSREAGLPSFACVKAKSMLGKRCDNYVRYVLCRTRKSGASHHEPHNPPSTAKAPKDGHRPSRSHP